MDYTHHYESPLGGITLASNGKELTGLWFDNQKYFGSTLNRPYIERLLPVFEKTALWLTDYFSGKNPDFTPGLNLHATFFQRVVWEILLTVPYGETISYGEIAGQAAKQMHLSGMSAQAVGGAVSRNPVLLIIPCHRVVGSNGHLTGYAGGIERKARLLEMEKTGRPRPPAEPTGCCF